MLRWSYTELIMHISGGSVLTQLSSSHNNTIKNAEISVLVRGEDKARVFKEQGLKTILFEGFDDSETIKQAASEHDVIIHTASGFHTECAKSLLSGLALRKQRTGKDVYYMHTSGTSNLADSPLLGLYPDYPHGIFSDRDPAHTLATLRAMNERYTYPQRTTDLTVVDLGSATGVKTYIFISPIIYGEGGGQFHKMTHQVPEMIRSATKEEQAWIVGKGEGIKNNVYIMDLALLYEVFLAAILDPETRVPSGKDGIFFTENGEHTWKEVGQGIAQAGVEMGVLKSEEVKSLSLEEATERLHWHDKVWTESGFVSSVRTSADVARSLGWKPKKSREGFKDHFLDEWKLVVREDGNSASKDFKIW